MNARRRLRGVDCGTGQDGDVDLLAPGDAVAHATNSTEITVDLAAILVSKVIVKFVDQAIRGAATEHSKLHEKIPFFENLMSLLPSGLD